MSFICGVQASSALSHDSQSGAEPPAPARRAPNEKLHAHKTSMGNPERLCASVSGTPKRRRAAAPQRRRLAAPGAGAASSAPTKTLRRWRVALGLLGGAEEDFADEALG